MSTSLPTRRRSTKAKATPTTPTISSPLQRRHSEEPRSTTSLLSPVQAPQHHLSVAAMLQHGNAFWLSPTLLASPISAPQNLPPLQLPAQQQQHQQQPTPLENIELIQSFQFPESELPPTQPFPLYTYTHLQQRSTNTPTWGSIYSNNSDSCDTTTFDSEELFAIQPNPSFGTSPPQQLDSLLANSLAIRNSRPTSHRSSPYLVPKNLSPVLPPSNLDALLFGPTETAVPSGSSSAPIGFSFTASQLHGQSSEDILSAGSSFSTDLFGFLDQQ
ncbi:hypothetical protein BCR33DRAFT_720644 [Rhizoclosmatium globosum]|uniref:Uncharacterized protein n=1 Tax=Rhizoclosmatium globosum TaxID=329046 RepID=A0A1Y2BV46_9FUNG|nr:hypothetical protein BCR33DRAFT_720644 [Rhizoclosmatium globosum]|eukprot:ORY38629.1 hypothetical protein BCR33DRAFT_720644 [Rhizoclosmatium globosum]